MFYRFLTMNKVVYNIHFSNLTRCSAAGEVTASLAESNGSLYRRVYGFGHLRADCVGYFHVILHKLCIVKINLCIIKCQIVYIFKNHFTGEGMKFGQLILRRIVKIVATKCQILRLKCTKIDFGLGSAPDPAGELTALPRPLSWI